MFRLATCLLIELDHCQWEDDWEETLRSLPPDLFGIYSRFLTRAIDALKRTVFIQAIFRWLVFSARQVKSDELADAIAFRLDDPAFDFSDPEKSIYHPNRRQGNSGIFKLLGGLIMIEESLGDVKDPEDALPHNQAIVKESHWAKPSIAFAHSSVKDYMLSMQFHQEFGTIIDLTEQVSHRFITQTCVRYLLLFADAKYSMTKDTLPDYPFSLYAGEYVFHHLRLCDDQDQEVLLPLIMHLLEDGSSQYAALYQLRPMARFHTRDWNKPISPALCMCSEMGYTEGVYSLLIKDNTYVDTATHGYYGMTALHLASQQGHLDIAQLLIDHNASVDTATRIDGKTALHLASHRVTSTLHGYSLITVHLLTQPTNLARLQCILHHSLVNSILHNCSLIAAHLWAQPTNLA
ncbi:hypothetical protein C8J57DRAFT_65221 [Mycena rebaudengoi]|nr:hypothetical protein C8J57DRAFT_65221 [Mycena rebaudengoi]